MALAGALAACALSAEAAHPAHSAQPPASSSHPASLEQAVRQVQNQTGGHILAADTVSRGNVQVYRVKVLTPTGKVKVMQLHSSPPARHRAAKSDPNHGGH